MNRQNSLDQLQPIIVEGTSDQHYLTGMKTLLVASGRLKPGRELVFPPANGTKGVKAVASIVGGRNEELPMVLFDSDAQGKATIRSLRESLYVGEPHLILDMESFTGIAGSEVEDLMPPEMVVRELDRWLRDSDVQFADEFQSGLPIVPQIEAWALRHKLELAKPGWKVELAKRVKQRMLADGPEALSADVPSRWEKLFVAFQGARSATKAAKLTA